MDAILRDKIITLFEYRELPTLIRYQSEEWDEQFYEDLIQLQYDIYMLDHELETHWDVDMTVIDARWQVIHRDLRTLGVEHHDLDRYSSHIYKYQKHELEIREHRLPTRLSMEYFYFYKSCDVKLLRRLIYDRNPDLGRAIPLSAWRLFDLVTEINDDVEDLQEDVTTINGNRFLISLMQHGVAPTKSHFLEFLSEIETRNQQKSSPLIEGIDIAAWTSQQVGDTRLMVHEQSRAFDDLDTALYKRHLFSQEHAIK